MSGGYRTIENRGQGTLVHHFFQRRGRSLRGATGEPVDGFCTLHHPGCGTTCNCTHTVDWYKDGFIVGTSAGVSPIATFTYFGPPPLAGNYYAVLKDDCCPGDSIISPLIKIEPTCFPLIKGPCFMCNGVPVIPEER
ncbi:MAG: hypothetical protein IPH04_01340 [Saprospirales bacterium]|nr:hypothetical protein [Saprospirales bacterium]